MSLPNPLPILPVYLALIQVLDEADKLLNMDFEEELNKILSVAPRQRNTYLFSATMTSKVWFHAQHALYLSLSIPRIVTNQNSCYNSVVVET